MVLRIFTVLVVVCVVQLLPRCDAASAHIRSHQHKTNGNERLEDGAFSPRDNYHYVDGEHHNEFDHEAILGSVKEAEEFDKLPVADMLTEEESKDRLEDADSNEDGRITWEEILHDTYGSDPEDLAIDEKLVSDDKATFDMADQDKDGFLNTQEFKAYTHPEETPRMFPFLLEQALDEKDTDKDGFISFQEFIGVKAKNENKEWLLVEKDKFDHEHDKNSDGKLDSTEILAWLVPSNEDLATDEVDHLFAASDDDHDNRLSFEEILEHHDVFVGSEATDYGDYLHDIERFTDEL
ncbi:hypothetical protein G9C98_004432 [Cotesia typhae]|uniref:EF-hand domain-containing protein n=1 Tax=Cotesia typhae TaxID=2053667 RepID=A0A8J5UUE8_9HYME|nr:hypothetical protein G9C98_004432 [Cotesia typhae]